MCPWIIILYVPLRLFDRTTCAPSNNSADAGFQNFVAGNDFNKGPYKKIANLLFLEFPDGLNAMASLNGVKRFKRDRRKDAEEDLRLRHGDAIAKLSWPVRKWFDHSRKTYDRRIGEVKGEIGELVEQGFVLPENEYLPPSLIAERKHIKSDKSASLLKLRATAYVLPLDELIENIAKYEGNLVVTNGNPVSYRTSDGPQKYWVIAVKDKGEPRDINVYPYNFEGEDALPVFVAPEDRRNQVYSVSSFAPVHDFLDGLVKEEWVVMGGLVKNSAFNADMLFGVVGGKIYLFSYVLQRNIMSNIS